ncbi:MAG: tRNA pseudouridine(38-40) synthase TruA [Flavobacteriaceae bacterium]|nr:tRNA pseudouridine(38-40) synthase TruA [Flavobacteriaceae bacterium]
MRYFIELSYHGKNYHGWQLQPNAKSIQEVLENSLSLLLSTSISVVGCGRTDAGVHASQFFLHFDIEKTLDEDQLKFKLNAFLPNDIAIIQIFLVNNDAHARFDATYRSYMYRISLVKDPFLADTSWQVRQDDLNITKMNNAAKLLMEYENFKSFSRSKTDVKTYNCSVSNAVWKRENNLLVFYITANRFLRNMVRAIVGTLLEVGKNNLSIEDFRSIIEGQDRTKAGASVKAKGLFLAEIGYPMDILMNRNVRTK